MSTIFDDLNSKKTVWLNPAKGLRKETIHVEDVASIQKPNHLSTCTVIISQIVNVNDYPTNYLRSDKNRKEIEIEIGNAITPLDCYIELFLMEMYVTEKSICFVQTKSGLSEICFVIEMLKISPTKYYCELTPGEMFSRAVQYKTNGVKMYPQYSTFAQNYFSKSAKCLLSFSIDDDLSGVTNKAEWRSLLENVYSNLAACLLKQQRFEEVIEILGFIEGNDVVLEKSNEKAVYRRALAYFNVKKYQAARKSLERIKYEHNSEMVKLWSKINSAEHNDKTRETDLAKKMLFG